MSSTVVLSQCIRVRGCGWHSSYKARQNIWPSFELIKSAPNYASASDYDTILRMLHRVKKGPLIRIGSFFGIHIRKKFPDDRLFAPLTER